MKTRIYYFPSGALLAIGPDRVPTLHPYAGWRLGLTYSRAWAADALRQLRRNGA